jgi:hypothetical protein
MSKPKLIIHETDCHGGGYIYYNGKCDDYIYDDGKWGDVKSTVEALIDIGFINPTDVAIFDNDAEIYKIVEKGLEINGKTE